MYFFALTRTIIGIIKLRFESSHNSFRYYFLKICKITLHLILPFFRYIIAQGNFWNLAFRGSVITCMVPIIEQLIFAFCLTQLTGLSQAKYRKRYRPYTYFTSSVNLMFLHFGETISKPHFSTHSVTTYLASLGLMQLHFSR